jgi:hypothetical protein
LIGTLKTTVEAKAAANEATASQRHTDGPPCPPDRDASAIASVTSVPACACPDRK